MLTRKHKVFQINWVFDSFSAPNVDQELDCKQYLALIDSTRDKISDLQGKLADPVFDGKDYENFDDQEHLLKVSS